jgi:hypothetical protein
MFRTTEIKEQAAEIPAATPQNKVDRSLAA